MRLTAEESWARLRTAEHAVLCTTNASGAIDAIPVCFAVVGARIATPIDMVKPKSTTELGRRTNLDRDPNATLLCEHWDRHDWSRLWWVRALLVHRITDDSVRTECEVALRGRYPQYEEEQFASVLVFDVTSTLGWSATG